MKKLKIAIADDHTLMRKGLVQLLEDSMFDVVSEAENGDELIKSIEKSRPEIVLMDINMPVMNGYETTEWLHKNHPDIKVMALSMYADDASIIRMIKSGAKGYLLKDVEPDVLRKALLTLMEKGVYYSELVVGRMMVNLHGDGDRDQDGMVHFTAREEEFLRMACSDLSMREIAEKMNVSPRTVDGYRDQLFQKLHIQSRVGLVLYAIKNRIFLVE